MKRQRTVKLNDRRERLAQAVRATGVQGVAKVLADLTEHQRREDRRAALSPEKP